VAIATGTIFAALVFRIGEWNEVALLGPAIGVLVLGLADDRITLSPTAKLVGSLAAGASWSG
jgi:UDP-N-acetylmuramyl pentapeptide phosphotransferase/UDP-N-acetylglucosamine-1-phosphate transferase